MKRPKELEVVALNVDLPKFGLHEGHVGTVVLVYETGAVEVEFFDREGETHALLTLNNFDVRRPTKAELTDSNAPEPWPAGTNVPIADASARVAR